MSRTVQKPVRAGQQLPHNIFIKVAKIYRDTFQVGSQGRQPEEGRNVTGYDSIQQERKISITDTDATVYKK